MTIFYKAISICAYILTEGLKVYFQTLCFFNLLPCTSFYAFKKVGKLC